MRNFTPGQLVEFHSEWPFHRHAATVLAVGQEANDSVAVIMYHGDQYFPERRGLVTCVPLWNNRLQPAGK